MWSENLRFQIRRQLNTADSELYIDSSKLLFCTGRELAETIFESGFENNARSMNVSFIWFSLLIVYAEIYEPIKEPWRLPHSHLQEHSHVSLFVVQIVNLAIPREYPVPRDPDKYNI